MATKRDRDIRAVGRAQAGRPQAAPQAHKHTDGERALVGALSVPIEQIQPDPGQPRKEFDPARLEELTASLHTYGVLQPLVVREEGLLDDGRTRYMIVAGGRRYAAAVRAGLTRLPVLLRDSEGAQLRILQLTENIQREALDPVDEARAFRELMDLETIDTRDVASRVHRSHTYVADRLKLIAHEDVAEAVAHGVLTPSAATEVARETDTARRQDLIQQAKVNGLQKRDVQRLRRATAPAPPTNGTVEPPRTSNGAPALEINAGGFPAAPLPGDTPGSVTPTVPDVLASPPLQASQVPPNYGGGRERPPEEHELERLVAHAGGARAVVDLLSWAAGAQLTLADLVQRVEQLSGTRAL